MEFEFDLSDDINSEKSNIVIKTTPEPAKKVIVPINRMDDLKKNEEVKNTVEYILWTNELISNEALIERFVEEFGFNRVLATNIVNIHRTAYLNDKGHYSLFGYNMHPPKYYIDLLRKEDGYVPEKVLRKAFKQAKNATKARGNSLAPFWNLLLN